MTRQPEDKRYSLRCAQVNERDIICDSKKSGGHIDSFETYQLARAAALVHPHAAIIAFWRHSDYPEPSQEFLDDLNLQDQT